MKLTLILIILVFFKLNAQISIEEKEIDNGILHKKIINTKDTLFINILQIDLSSGDYTIESVKAKSLLNAREKTSEIAKAFNDSVHNVIAALNADFFEADGEIINNMISKGTIVKAVKFTDSPFNSFVNTQFAFTLDNKPLIEQFVFSGNIILPDGNREEIKRVNSFPDSNSISIYNHYQGNRTPKIPENWFTAEFVLDFISDDNDTLKFIVDRNLRRRKHRI